MHYSIRRAQYLHALFIVTMIAMILLGFLQAWQKNNAILSFDQSLNTLTEYQYLFDTEIIAPANLNNSDFVTSDFNQAPVRYGKLNQWFKIDITNTQPTFQQLTLILDNPMSDSLTLYQKENNEYKKIATYGDKVKGVEKTQRVLPHYSFQLDTGKTKTYLIHNQNTSAPFLPIIVIATEDFISYEKTLHLIWGTFIGVILLMSAYNLVLYLGVGDRAYFSYICYIFSLLMMLGVVHGYGYYVFPESLQLWLSDKVIFLDFCVAYFTLMFALHFLRFTKQDGAIFQVTHFFSYALVALAVFSLFTPEYLSAQVFSVAQTFTYIMTFWLIYLKVRQNFRWTKYYILSWIPFFIGAAIGFLLFSGVIHYSFFTRHALMFSVIFEMAFISMALADRLGDTERRRLYQATHDFKLGFANESLLEDTILKVASTPESVNFTLITIEISNYDAVIPYIEEEKFSRLIIQMAKSFEHQLSNHLQLVKIDPHDKKNSNIALIRGEILCFLVQDNNIFSIKSTLKKISNSDNYNPLQKEIPYRIHCVFGAAVFDEHRTNALDIINEAKRAVTQASELKQPFQVYSQSNNAISERKVRLAQDLGNAIDNNELVLYHQPQIYVRDSSAKSSEALVRWFHDELGEISPVEFVQIAEQTGLIKRLTLWVIDTAFAQYNKLKQDNQTNINMSINISAGDLSRQDFVNDIETRLAHHNIRADHFTLELTETASLTDQTTFKENFEKLTQLGFSFAIDDFGTGYSSLEYANDHPFGELKIDRSFITDVLSSRKRLTIVSATISMAKELGLHITAEGVEDINTLQSLKTLGCDKIQGFLIAKPMTFADYCQWEYNPSADQNIVGENFSIPFETDKPTSQN